MEYKLSNSASLTLLHEELGVPCKYPNIYKPSLKIDGLKEQTVPVVTMEEPNYITQGLWGILPQNFEGDWKKFQRIKKTLHVRAKDIPKNILFKEAIEKRRCLIVVTGFYTHHLVGKKIQNYLAELNPLKPFYIAGIYNVLEDGFITCSIINVSMNESLGSFNNLYKVMPLQIPKLLKKIWLDKTTSSTKINHIISKPYTMNLIEQKISN